MKIYIPFVNPILQPDTRGVSLPPGNDDWDVEVDFYNYLCQHNELLTSKKVEADWYYLPVFWNRYYIVNDWGNKGLELLSRCVNESLAGLDGKRIFTVCEYDLFALSPQIDLRGGLVMCSSKRGDGRFIDIPLLRSRHNLSNTRKWLLASFVGNTQTDGIRMDMEAACQSIPDVLCNHTFKDPQLWAQMVESSYIALCPRGQGASSFRFYEAMQLGTVPMHIGAPDVRPFKNQFEWDGYSLYAPTIQDMLNLLVEWRGKRGTLLTMGNHAKYVYDTFLSYGKWPELALRELDRQ